MYNTRTWHFFNIDTFVLSYELTHYIITYKHFLSQLILVASSISLDSKSFEFSAYFVKECVLIKFLFIFI